jgi:hypothetical protein
MSVSFEAGSSPQAGPGPPGGYFFIQEGEIWTPKGPSRSPWDRNALSGMAVAGLLAHLAEQAPAPVPMLPAHLTIDILRPVPYAPLRTRTVVAREGRRMQLVESHLLADDEPVARARVLRIREAPSPSVDAPLPYPAPEDAGRQPYFPPDHGMLRILETRLVPGVTVGPTKGGVIWARYEAELAPGLPITGVVMAAMLSDFGNGLSRLVDRREWSFANLDISVHLVRRPVGEWMLVAADGLLQGLGVGLSNMMLADRQGEVGRAHQSLFIAPLRPAAG